MAGSKQSKRKTPTPGVDGGQGRSARPLHKRRRLGLCTVRAAAAFVVLVKYRPRSTGRDWVLHRLPDLLVGRQLLRLLRQREAATLPRRAGVVEYRVRVEAADAPLEAAAVVMARAAPRRVTCSRTETNKNGSETCMGVNSQQRPEPKEIRAARLPSFACAFRTGSMNSKSKTEQHCFSLETKSVFKAFVTLTRACECEAVSDVCLFVYLTFCLRSVFSVSSFPYYAPAGGAPTPPAKCSPGRGGISVVSNSS